MPLRVVLALCFAALLTGCGFHLRGNSSGNLPYKTWSPLRHWQVGPGSKVGLKLFNFGLLFLFQRVTAISNLGKFLSCKISSLLDGHNTILAQADTNRGGAAFGSGVDNEGLGRCTNTKSQVFADAADVRI